MTDNFCLQGASILYAEDEEELRNAVARALRRRGAMVVEAGNGSEALRILEGFNPHILLTDLRMPGLDGTGLIEAVRALALDFPIVVLSASPLPERVVKEVALCLTKPVNLTEAMAELSKIWQLITVE